MATRSTTTTPIQDEFLRRRRIAIPEQVRDPDVATDALGRQIIGEPRTLHPGEADNLGTYAKFDLRIFKLDVDADIEAYRKVQEGAANRRYKIVKRIDMSNPADGFVRVYLEWLEFKTVIPKQDPQVLYG